MLNQVFGGSPPAVLLRLALLSILVGAGMTWLDIDPWDIILGVERMAEHLWATGFLGMRQLGHYLLAGAAIVVPLWILSRILTVRPTAAQRGPSRWQPLSDRPADSLRSEPRD